MDKRQKVVQVNQEEVPKDEREGYRFREGDADMHARGQERRIVCTWDEGGQKGGDKKQATS